MTTYQLVGCKHPASTPPAIGLHVPPGRLSVRWDATPLQLRLQKMNGHRSTKISEYGEDMHKVRPVNRRTAPAWGSPRMSKGGAISAQQPDTVHATGEHRILHNIEGTIFELFCVLQNVFYICCFVDSHALLYHCIG